MVSSADADSKSLNKGDLEMTEAIKERGVIVFTGPGKARPPLPWGLPYARSGMVGR